MYLTTDFKGTTEESKNDCHLVNSQTVLSPATITTTTNKKQKKKTEIASSRKKPKTVEKQTASPAIDSGRPKRTFTSNRKAAKNTCDASESSDEIFSP